MNIDKAKRLKRAHQIYAERMNGDPMTEAIWCLCLMVADLEQDRDRCMKLAEDNLKAGR